MDEQHEGVGQMAANHVAALKAICELSGTCYQCALSAMIVTALLEFDNMLIDGDKEVMKLALLDAVGDILKKDERKMH